MRGRGFLAVAMAAMLLVAGCSKSDGSDAKKKDVEIPDQPAGLDGKAFCAKVSKELITEAIKAPYRTYDPVPLDDFPAPGVRGYECQWEWTNPAGDSRSLKVDALYFDGALEGSLDASWKSTVDLLSGAGKKLSNVGDDAMQAKLQGLVTVTARKGNTQVTAVSGAKGAAAPATVDALSLVAGTVLDVGTKPSG